MRKFWVLLVLVLAIGVMIAPVAAQDATATVMPPATPEATAAVNSNNNQNRQGTVNGQQVHRIRIVYLSQTGPDLVPYINGKPSGIQNLSKSSAVSGWVEFSGPVTLSLVPMGDSQRHAAVGPIQLGSSFSPWTTIVVTDNAGKWNAVAIRENVANIPANCARVTVFQAFNGSANSTNTSNSGNTTGSTGAQGNTTGNTQSGSNSTNNSSNTQSNESIGMLNSQNMMTDLGCASSNATGSTGAQGNTTGSQAASSNGLGAVSCVAIIGGARSSQSNTTAQSNTTGSTGAQGNTTGTTQSNQGMNQSGSNSASNNQSNQAASQNPLNLPMATFGTTTDNCAFTFDVAAGTESGKAMSSLGLTAFQNTPATTFQAGNYYFIAAFGDSAHPQFVVWNTSAGPVSGLINSNAQGSNQGSQGAQGSNSGQSGSGSGSGG